MSLIALNAYTSEDEVVMEKPEPNKIVRRIVHLKKREELGITFMTLRFRTHDFSRVSKVQGDRS